VYIHGMKENEIRRRKKEITGDGRVVCGGGKGVRNQHPSRNRRRRVMPLPSSELRYGYVVRQRKKERKEKGKKEREVIISLPNTSSLKKRMWCLQRKE